jgi:hypothetical protein
MFLRLSAQRLGPSLLAQNWLLLRWFLGETAVGREEKALVELRFMAAQVAAAGDTPGQHSTQLILRMAQQITM